MPMSELSKEDDSPDGHCSCLLDPGLFFEILSHGFCILVFSVKILSSVS
jgi:hypothetical protein